MRLELDRISKSYGQRSVLHNIAAEVETGEALLVTGHNGSGKSTLLRLLAGLQRPTGGTIRYIAAGITYSPLRAQGLVGLVGADVQLYRELTADEHIDFVARLRGLSLTPQLRNGELERVGLGGRGTEQVGGFSSGMVQRMRYVLALLHRPPVLLLDEPTTNLDQEGIAMVDEIVAEQRQQGLLVIATNDRRDLHYGDLVLTLDAHTN
ncbi:MAG: ABC transporter ATP-binding protein [Herpetosiphonaceae bacterium]|nr:ABC transporter ATP-binding protein [Herpetosiphonaceae bacterium]